MRLVVFCLFAVCCFSLAKQSMARTDRRLERKLQEVRRELLVVKERLQHNDKMLNTPPINIEDCCCLPALQCFRANLKVEFNVTERDQSKLYRSLKSHITESGLNFCNSGNTSSTCQSCDSHPKASAREFFDRLETLIQRAINRLSPN